MDPRTKALLFLLEEQVKKHPTSAAALTARGLIDDIAKVEKPDAEIIVNYDSSDRGPVRVPIAGSEPREREPGEAQGSTGPGVEADLIRGV